MSYPEGMFPTHWKYQQLAEIGEWAGGGTPSKSNDAYWLDGDVPWVSPKDMKKVVLTDSQDKITRAASEESAAKRRPAGSVACVTRSGILEHSFPVALVPFEAAFNQDMKVLTPHDGVDARWLTWALVGAGRNILDSCRKDGTTVASIDSERLRQYSLGVPPLDEQRAIVAAIEDALARIDAIEAELRAVRTSRDSFRAAVLRDAFSGALLPDGGAGLEAPANGELSEELLPPGWRVVPLDEINDPNRPICYGILMPGPDRPEGVPYVKVKNMRHDRVVLDGIHRTSEEIEGKYARSRLKSGDLLMSIRGTYGRTAVVPPELDGGNITQDTARIAPVGADPAFLFRLLQGPRAQIYLKGVARGVAVKGVNIRDLRKLPIPLPPIEEQRAIVAAIEDAFTRIDAVNAEATMAEAGMVALRASVLHRAFTGELSIAHTSDKQGVV